MFSHRRLLITGGCGFIGSNYINYHYREFSGDFIINLDAMYYCANENNILPDIRVSGNYKLIKGNTCNIDFVKHLLEEYQITHIIHFAAQSHVQNSFEDSLRYTEDNVLGTHNLLEACRQYNKLKLFIHVSTDEVYGESLLESNSEANHEKSILCPTNPYAATKASAEMIAMSYYFSFNIPIIITRGNNVYGPNQYPEKLIPRFIQLLKNNKKVTIQGTGECVRSFLYVDDVVKAFAIILEKGVIGEIYNIGGDDSHEYSVMTVAIKLIRLIKGNDVIIENWIDYISDRPFNDKRYYINSKKLRELGWKPNIDLDEGLSKLILHKK